MRPIIKWPGGKSRELEHFVQLIPAYDRYIEPFFGGGALFFHLSPQAAVVNDISSSLMQFYRLVKTQDHELHELLLCYHDSFSQLVSICGARVPELLRIFSQLQSGALSQDGLTSAAAELIGGLVGQLDTSFQELLLLDRAAFEQELLHMVKDKFLRTVKNHAKQPFTPEDLCENLLTGFTSGYYMYFRRVFNDIQLGRITDVSAPYQAANFYFIREYCYGSMFRYNASGEFNIPYGGMSYNRKDLRSKLDAMFNTEIQALFARTELYCCDFEEFFRQIRPTSKDLIFLDPPYDTDFSDYEGRDFTRADQVRLATALKQTPAHFILVIKNTDFIWDLYEKSGFHILSFDKQYTYNVRSRNERAAEHLIITDLPV